MKLSSKYALIILPLAISLVLIWYFKAIVSYVVLAWVLSMIGAPIMRFFKKFLPNTVSAIATLVVFTLVLGAIFLLFVPPLVQQARNLASVDYERIAASLEEPVEDWNQWLIKKGLLPPKQEVKVIEEKTAEEEALNNYAVINLDSLNGIHRDTSDQNVTLLININNTSESNGLKEDGMEAEEPLFEKIRNNVLRIFDPSKIPQLFGSVFGFMSNMMITLLSVYFIAFFFLKEQGLFERMIQSIVSNTYETQAVQAINESSNLLIRYFLGVAIQIVIITIFVAGALSLFGIKNALLIGFFAALLNVIPYLGPIIGAAFGVIITISSSLDTGVNGTAELANNAGFYSDVLPQLLIVVGVFAVMQLLDNFLVQPNIFSKSVKAHPLEIFIVVLAGAQIGGITGMVLAIPAYTVLRVIASIFLSQFKIVQSITKDL